MPNDPSEEQKLEARRAKILKYLDELKISPVSDLSIEEILDLDENGIPRSPYNESLRPAKDRSSG